MEVSGVTSDRGENFTTATMCTAIRGIRFLFGHTQWIQKVRVVNMSFAGSKGGWGPKGDMKWNISRDLVFNDRLWVASAGQAAVAGNPGQRKLMYPAAHSNVLGVTGALAVYAGGGDWNFQVHPESNYWDLVEPQENSAYPVSGIYAFFPKPDAQWLPCPTMPQGWLLRLDGADYDVSGGTSEAAAQISALGFLLYDQKVRQTGNNLASSRYLVKCRIVYTSYPDMVFQGNPPHVLAGVAYFRDALNGW
jgi:hypothetical protein